ncbi:MAG: sulfatase-like hydrolase/transferase, partial [Bacteroidetes bacterium]|nr:sulfatase-like hydrolase/transferase [Bacteroidota bacterium]
MVIFFSDNGGPPTTGAWNLPLAGSKFTLWEGGIRVPFIVSRPGAPDAGVLSDRPVSTLDVLPTCLRASGVEIPEGLDGEVISEAFDRSEEQPVDRSLFWKWNGGYAARCGDWKLLHRGGASRTPCSGIVERTDLLQSTCLFNLREDPSESLNLISEHPEIAERLQTEYSDWQENVVGSHAQELQSPNIVLFLVDDMGLMDTSVPMLTDENGEPQAHPLNDWYRTPNMERLAERGTRFSDFYAHSVCSPTRVSILTGQNSARHHTTDYINPWENNRYLDNKAYPLEFCQHTPPGWKWEGLGSADITLSSMLKQAGYTTIHVGKAHFAPFEHKGEDPLNLGFDVNVAGAAIGAPGSYYGEEGYGINSKNPLARPVPGLDKYHGTSTFLTEALTLEAQAELDKALTNDQPFFLYMSHYAVHSPFNSDPRFADHYKDPDKNRNVQAYATMIEGMDKSLGDLMDHLDAKGIADNTLIFFLGDNGGDCPSGGYNEISSSAPLRGRKGSRWEGGVRVPFIAAWAKQDPKNRWQKKMPVVAGSIRAEVASCYDLFPTILEMLGIPVPEAHTVDGQDLSKLLSGNQDPGHRDEFLSHYPHPRKDQNNYFSIYRSGKWKLHYEYLEEGVRYSLYDLESDPDESLNLAPENPEKLRAMMKAMFRELESMGAQYPVDGHDRELKPVIP